MHGPAGQTRRFNSLLALWFCRSICIQRKGALDKTAKVLHGSAERLHHGRWGIARTPLSAHSHSFSPLSDTFVTFSRCSFLRIFDTITQFSFSSHPLLFSLSSLKLSSVLHNLTYIDLPPLSSLHFACYTSFLRLHIPFPLLSSPSPRHQFWLPALPPQLLAISSHFPDCSTLSLSNAPFCLIPSLLHQTNSYIIQRGNERVGGSARPEQRVNPSPFMYQSRCCPLLIPAPWLAGRAVSQTIWGGGVLGLDCACRRASQRHLLHLNRAGLGKQTRTHACPHTR